jgi:hypothetical protein
VATGALASVGMVSFSALPQMGQVSVDSGISVILKRT